MAIQQQLVMAGVFAPIQPTGPMPIYSAPGTQQFMAIPQQPMALPQPQLQMLPQATPTAVPFPPDLSMPPPQQPTLAASYQMIAPPPQTSVPFPPDLTMPPPSAPVLGQQITSASDRYE